VKNKTYKVTYKKHRPFSAINIGSTQDARATLIGNTQFSKETGTFFQESPFVKAISTPNSIVLLDELSRAHPDAMNILMPVLDNQKYLRLDESGGKIVRVADNVSFIATANVGNDYTATRVMDKALLDRFTVKIEVDLPTQAEEMELVKQHAPDADLKIMKSITQIAETTRMFFSDSKLSKFVSTRSVVEMAELTIDGFDLVELAEMIIYPDYPDDGGVDSERTMVKQIVQKYVPTKAAAAPITGSPDNPDDLPPF
jgi:MoxR-like ATPase